MVGVSPEIGCPTETLFALRRRWNITVWFAGPRRGRPAGDADVLITFSWAKAGIFVELNNLA
jgi:hypothetical protein